MTMTNYLIHYGQPGRSGKKGAGLYYRNNELTEAGKRHYYGEKQRLGGKRDELKSLVRLKKSGSVDNSESKPSKKEKPESSTWRSKDASRLSDAELNRRNSRLQREKQYREMTQTKGQKAAKWLKRTASAILVATAIEALKNHMQNTVYKNTISKYGPKLTSKIKSLPKYLPEGTKTKVASTMAAVMMNRSMKKLG